MSPLATQIQTAINKYVRTYGKEAFDDMRLNSILNQMLLLADAAGGGPVTSGKTIVLTSASFTTATDCPITSVSGSQLAIFWNESQRFLNFDQGEYSYLAGGGFRIIIAGFDKSNDNYHFYATVL